MKRKEFRESITMTLIILVVIGIININSLTMRNILIVVLAVTNIILSVIQIKKQK